MIRRALAALVVMAAMGVTATADPLAAAPAASNQALAAGHDLRGHHAAYTAAIGGPDTRPASIDVSVHLGSLVLGRARIEDRAFTVIGTATSSGALSLVGVDGSGTLTIDAHLLDLLDPDGADPGGFTPCIFEGRWRTTSLRGGSRSGALVAVHQDGVTGAPSIEGAWGGTIGAIGGPDTRPVFGSFTQTPTGAYAGRMQTELRLPDGSDRRVGMAVSGQAFWDGRIAGYESVGGDGGILFMRESVALPTDDGGPPRVLVGAVRFLFADGQAQQAPIRWERASA